MRVAPGQLVELQIPARSPLTGRLRVNGTERPLPIGSSLAGDRFRCRPAPGFLGAFALEFVDQDGTVTHLRIVVAVK